MPSTLRAAIVLVGGAIAALGYFVVPGLYALRYSPPAGVPHAEVALNHLRGFSTQGTEHAALYGHDTTPRSFFLVLVAAVVIAVAALGLAVVEGPDGTRFAGRIKKRWLLWAGAAGLGVFAVRLLLIFLGGVPESLHAAFVKDLGGRADAVAAAGHLAPSPAFGTIVLVLGVLIMVAAVVPWIGVPAIFLAIVGGLVLVFGWRGVIATVGPILAIGFLLYMLLFRVTVVVSVIGLIFSTFVLFWGLSVVWQGSGHHVPLFAGGRALTLRTDGKDVDGDIYVAIGAVGSLLGLYLVFRSIRSIIQAWRKGMETAHLEEVADIPYVAGRPDLGTYSWRPPKESPDDL